MLLPMPFANLRHPPRVPRAISSYKTKTRQFSPLPNPKLLSATAPSREKKAISAEKHKLRGAGETGEMDTRKGGVVGPWGVGCALANIGLHRGQDP